MKSSPYEMNILCLLSDPFAIWEAWLINLEALNSALKLSRVGSSIIGPSSGVSLSSRPNYSTKP